MRLTANFCCVSGTSIPVEELLRAHTGKTPDEIVKLIDTTGVRALSTLADKRLSAFIDRSLIRIVALDPSALADLDAIVVVSQTYDFALPSMSTRIQAALGCRSDTFCVDINDGCAGFVKAAQLAHLLITSGRRRVLVVAGDINSRMTEGADIATRILFGDGVSFSLFEASDDAFDVALFNDGRNAGHISCASGPAALQMNGFEVFRFTRNVVPGLVKDYLRSRELSAEVFDLIGFHQASALIVKALGAATGLHNRHGSDFNCGDIGNIGAGSIGAWLAGNTGIPRATPLRMLAIGYGAGLSWGLVDFFINLERFNEVLHVDSDL